MAPLNLSSKDKQLRKSQHQQSFLQQLADFTPDLLFVIDLGSRDILYINSRVEQLLGHDADYIYDMGPDIFKVLVHPQDYELRMANLEACRQLPDHGDKMVEVRLKLAAGNWNWFKIKDKIFKRDTDGQVVQTIGIAQNIHEQKIAEKKLQEEHRRFKDAQVIGHIGSFERNLPGDILYCSDEFFRIHGLEPQPEGMDLQQFLSYIHPDDQERCMAAIYHTHETAEPFDLVNRIIRPDGSIRYVHRRAALMHDEKGKPCRVYGTVQDITERKKTEQELLLLKDKLTQQAVNKYRTLFNSIDEGFCILEVIVSEEKESSGKQITDYRFIDTNPAFERHLSIKETRGKSIYDLLPHISPSYLNKYGEKALTGQPIRFENYVPSMERWFDINAFRIGSPEDRHVAILFTDITDRKLAEEALHRSKKRLQKALSIETVGVIFFDLKGQIYDANKAFQQMSGYSHKDFINGRVRWDKATPPEFMEATLKAREELLTAGQNTPYEKQYSRPDNSRWWGLFAGKRLSENECVGFVVDIGKQKKAEQQLKEFNSLLEQQVSERTRALQENAHFIRKVADITPDIIFVYNLEQMRLQYINRDLYSLLGKSQETLRAMTPEVLFSLLHPDDREAAHDMMHSFANATDEELREMEFRLRNKQKEWRWFHCRSRVFKRNEEGRVVQLLSIMRDITEEKNTTKALLEAEKLSVKGTMARTIAHEVRGPAANIALAMEMLQQELEQELKGREDALVYFHIISKSCNRITNYINELLNISLSEPGAFIECDVAMIAEEVLSQAQDRLFLKEVKVERHFQKGAIISADRERLKVAFLNIMMNAIEAMEKQKGILHLFVFQENNHVHFSVQDNGCGMTQEQLSRMFDAYYTSKPKGLGVGLANVKAILQDHAANIQVESEAGKGTTFTVIFSAPT